MPQLNPLDWAPQLIWLAITFGILYLLMKWVALPKIGSVSEAREARIAGDLEAADKLRRQTEEAIAAYEQALAEARIHQTKVSALEDVNGVASETAAEIVRRLIGVAPSQPESSAAVAAARKE